MAATPNQLESVVTVGPFPRALLEQMASGHRSYLEGSLFNYLGLGFIRKFYQFTVRDADNFTCVRQKESQCLGLAMVSFHSSRLTRQILADARLCSALVLALWRPRAFFHLASSMFGKTDSDIPPDMPELLFFFTTKEARGQGIARCLLTDVEKILREKGVSEYFVKTTRSDDNAAIFFYKKANFVVDDRMPNNDEKFVYFVKQVPEIVKAVS